MNGVERIAIERQRQITDEGWTAEHDDQHVRGQLGWAAAAYCTVTEDTSPPPFWPFSAEWWKPSTDDPIRDLVKAGALIAAEIDRRLRVEASEKKAAGD